MKIVQITPGAGGMFCGGCLRDNALVGALRKLGHSTLMVPLYLPLTLDEADNSSDTPIFFSGINVYFDQKSALFRRLPRWLHRMLAGRGLLKLAAGFAGKTRAEEVGDLMLSMIRGEEGNQARELEELIDWLGTNERPDVICLSNALLVGMARRLKQSLGVPIVCFLQGEDSFLDSLPEAQRTATWKILATRAADVDLFIAPSRYFGDRMRERLWLPAEKVRVIYNGINLEGYGVAAGVSSAVEPGRLARRNARESSNAANANLLSLPARNERGEGHPMQNAPPLPSPLLPRREEREKDESSGVASSSNSMAVGSRRPTLGYFARMCKEKGLDTLVEAFIALKRRARVQHLSLRVGGGRGPADELFVKALRERLRAEGLLGDVEFFPNLDRAAKLEFLRSLTVLCTPALYGEAFGLYVIEAMAAGVPVVQPRHAAFPELIEATGGGLICEPSAEALADGLEQLLLDPERARALGEAGRTAVFRDFSIERMAERVAQVCAEISIRKS